MLRKTPAQKKSPAGAREYFVDVRPLDIAWAEKAARLADHLLRKPLSKVQAKSLRTPKSVSVCLALFPLRAFPSDLVRLLGPSMLRHPYVSGALANLFPIAQRGPGLMNPDPLATYSWERIRQLDDVELPEGHTAAEDVLSPETEDREAAKEARDEIDRLRKLSRVQGGHYVRPRTHRELMILNVYERLKEKHPSAKDRYRLIANANGMKQSAVAAAIKDARKRLREQ